MPQWVTPTTLDRSTNISMEGQSGQKEHLLISSNDSLILINDLLILKNGMIYYY